MNTRQYVATQTTYVEFHFSSSTTGLHAGTRTGRVRLLICSYKTHTHTHTHIVRRSAGVNSEDIFTVRVSNSRQRHSYKLYMPYSKSTVRYNYKPARHRDAEGLIFYRGGFFFFLSSFFFRRLISEFTERISTKLGHIFTCDCCLKNLVQTPPRIHPHGLGAKTRFLGPTLNFDRT